MPLGFRPLASAPLASQIAAAAAPNTVTVPLATIAVAGQAPSVARTAHQAIAVPVASIVVAAQAPSIARTANQSVVVPLATITVVGQTPSVASTANQSIAVPAAAITVAGQAPTIASTAGQNVVVPLASVSVVAQMPTIARTANQSVAVPLVTVTVEGQTPAVGQGRRVDVPLATVTVAGQTPSVSQTHSIVINVPVANIDVTGQAPTIPGLAPQQVSVGPGIPQPRLPRAVIDCTIQTGQGSQSVNGRLELLLGVNIRSGAVRPRKGAIALDAQDEHWQSTEAKADLYFAASVVTQHKQGAAAIAWLRMVSKVKSGSAGQEMDGLSEIGEKCAAIVVEDIPSVPSYEP